MGIPISGQSNARRRRRIRSRPRPDREETLALLPLAEEEAAGLLASVPEDQRSACWWLVRQNGTLVKGDEGGGVMLLTELQLTRPLGRDLGTLRLSPVVDFGDKLLARGRGVIGRLVPDGAPPRRYP